MNNVGKLLTPSKEDYLRILFDLSKENAYIHSVDIAKKMKISLPSVSRAMKELSESGFITKVIYGPISLTEKGVAAASVVKKRNELLLKFLTQVLNVEQTTAIQDACRMEHVLSEETTKKLECSLEKLIYYANECIGERRAF